MLSEGEKRGPYSTDEAQLERMRLCVVRKAISSRRPDANITRYDADESMRLNELRMQTCSKTKEKTRRDGYRGANASASRLSAAAALEKLILHGTRAG